MLLVNDVYVTDTLRDGTGGVARVAALRDSIERATRSRVYFVLAGDFLSPSILGKWYGGAQMTDAFGAARLDLAVFGNHEFDGSRANLLARVAESRFRWLSGNCYERNGQSFAGTRNWDTLRLGGVRVGIYGSVITREYPAYVDCRDADAATTALVDTLQRAGAELIVGLTHRNFRDDTATLARDPRITAILGGHDHDGRKYSRGPQLLVKAMSNVRTAVLVTFTERNGVWRADEQTLTTKRGMREEPRTKATVQRWQDSLVKRIGPDRTIGIAAEPINAIDSLNRRESRFGNLVADGIRHGTDADVGMINSGALRYDDIMPAGPITRHMFEAVFLFADETRVVTFSLTGARLRELLENGVRTGGLGDGPYPQISGVRFAIDARRPSGQRIVGDLTRDDGRVIGPTDMLRVSFVTFPACRGGDGYRIPEAEAACAAYAANNASAPRTVDLLVRRVEGMGGRIVLPEIGRVRRVDR